MAPQEAGTALPGRKNESTKAQKKEKAAQKPKQQAKMAASTDTKGITVKKEDDLAEWYQQMLSKGQFISYYDISGCYILEPASYAIWEEIKTWFDKNIKTLGVRNCYYPVFISKKNLEIEKEHIEGFAAEVAWVTQGGKTKLEEPIAVRPTSETAMYKDFHDKIQSHRDLPLKRNQWNNVVRWEFRNPMPFIRSREFLWQEGHTAHLTEEEAGKEVLQILDFYAGVYEYLLAVPVVKGRKTANEQFPGAFYTTTIEGFVPSTGRGIQAATSHCLGQHFAKMYDITVEDPSPKKEGEVAKRLYVWQNSWGLTTRSIGVMMLIHGDDKGAVIPPRVAEIQAIIIPVGVTAKTTEEAKKHLYDTIEKIHKTLKDTGVRAEMDLRDNYSPGWKFSDWELKGVPLRIEFGPKDAEKGVVSTARRDTNEKATIPITELATGVPAALEKMQNEMFDRAKKEYDSHRKMVTEWEQIVPVLNGKNVVLVPHCADGDCADAVKDETAKLGQAANAVEDAKAPSMGAKGKSPCAATLFVFERDSASDLRRRRFVGATSSNKPSDPKERPGTWLLRCHAPSGSDDGALKTRCDRRDALLYSRVDLLRDCTCRIGIVQTEALSTRESFLHRPHSETPKRQNARTPPSRSVGGVSHPAFSPQRLFDFAGRVSEFSFSPDAGPESVDEESEAEAHRDDDDDDDDDDDGDDGLGAVVMMIAAAMMMVMMAAMGDDGDDGGDGDDGDDDGVMVMMGRQR